MTFRDAARLAEAAAQRFVRLSLDATEEKGGFTVALAGGSTPRATYELLSSGDYAGQINWERVHVFWGDERMVPADHPDSNCRMARQALLDHVPIPKANVHHMAGELPPDDAARAYELELRATLGKEGRFDLILLGMGSDGHTASLFPGTTALAERDRWVVPVYVESLNAWRVTLTFPVINAARHVIFLVSGADKADAVAKIRAGESLPAAAVQPSDGEIVWMVDAEALGL